MPAACAFVNHDRKSSIATSLIVLKSVTEDGAWERSDNVVMPNSIEVVVSMFYMV